MSVSHRDDLCNDPEERLLEADSDADEDLADDKGVHVLCESTDDAADECNDTTDDEEPCRPMSACWGELVTPERTLSSPAKDVGQLAYHEEDNGAKHDIC